MSAPQVLLIGAGMIAHDQILPALYQMQRKGKIGEITICSQRESSLRELAEAPGILRAFPGHKFRSVAGGRFAEEIAKLTARQIALQNQMIT